MSHRDVALFWRRATVSTKTVSPVRHWTRPPGASVVKLMPSKEYRLMSAVAMSMSFAVQFRPLALARPGVSLGLANESSPMHAPGPFAGSVTPKLGTVGGAAVGLSSRPHATAKNPTPPTSAALAALVNPLDRRVRNVVARRPMLGVGPSICRSPSVKGLGEPDAHPLPRKRSY